MLLSFQVSERKTARPRMIVCSHSVEQTLQWTVTKTFAPVHVRQKWIYECMKIIKNEDFRPDKDFFRFNDPIFFFRVMSFLFSWFACMHCLVECIFTSLIWGGYFFLDNIVVLPGLSPRLHIYDLLNLFDFIFTFGRSSRWF